MATPRVLIFGAGSLGIVLGAFLHKSGAEVVCLCRSNYHAAQIHGFKVSSPAFGTYLYRPIVVQSLSSALALAGQPYDYIIICAKAFPDEDASTADMISDAVSNEHTSIVITQNGIGVEEAYKGRFPANLIISGVLYMPSTRVSPTDVVQTERHRIIMGAYPSHALSGEEEHKIRGLASMLNAAGAHAELHEDIQVERWKKLIGNATWNPICALSRCRDVQFLGSSDSAGRFIEAAMREVAAVARAIGYGEEVNEDAIKAQIQRSAIRNYPGVQPSMMADMLGGSRMEVEAIVGQVFRIAEEHGVSVPRLETLYVLAAGLDRSISQKQTSCS